MNFKELGAHISLKSQRWLVTGSAGFIGSHITEFLLHHGQNVVGYDNLSNSSQENIDHVKNVFGSEASSRYKLIKADVCNKEDLIKATQGCDYVIHQAGVGSVPRSIVDPISTHEANITGTLNVLIAAEKAKVKKVVYASSSSVYGDTQIFPQTEEHIGSPLSPYAVSKRTCEIYGLNFSHVYQLPTIGLRYFNVFGPRQKPDGPYAAVIPKWIDALINDAPTEIHGDGETSRDFCYVKNVVKANILAAISTDPAASAQIYNVALGGGTSLNELHHILSELIAAKMGKKMRPPQYSPFRKGDIRHSKADISKAQNLLSFTPEFTVSEGLADTVASYLP